MNGVCEVGQEFGVENYCTTISIVEKVKGEIILQRNIDVIPLSQFDSFFSMRFIGNQISM